MTGTTSLACACGQLHLELAKPPIMSVECHCDNCRAAGARLKALPGAPAIRQRDGGTHFVLYRKDRVRFVAGEGGLREFRLTPKSETRRAVTACCNNTPVFLEFQNGQWLSLYAGLWPEATRPAPEMRTMTNDAVAVPARRPVERQAPVAGLHRKPARRLDRHGIPQPEDRSWRSHRCLRSPTRPGTTTASPSRTWFRQTTSSV